MNKQVKRQACRALLLNNKDELLLIEIQEPGTEYRFWITPGGGRKDDESAESALRRELSEELHLDEFEMGPHVWNRRHIFTWEDNHYDQREAYYLIKVEDFNPGGFSRLEEIEKRCFLSFRWWPLEEIVRAREETFVPVDIGQRVLTLLKDGVPSEPYEVGL